MKYILLFLTVISCQHGLFAQQRIFLGKVVGEDQERLSGLDISIEGGNPTTTDDDGLFRIALSNEDVRRGMVTLNVPGYKIMRPEGGEAMLPLSQEMVTTVSVKKAGTSPSQAKIKELETKIKKLSTEKALKDNELQGKLAEIETIKKTHQANLQKAAAQLDSLNKVIETLRVEGSKIDNTLVELATQRKQLFYNDLSETLLNYVDKLKNFRDWMPRISDVFLNDGAMSQFNAVVSSYNIARDSLYNKHKALETGLGQYWEQEKLVLRLEDVNDMALSEIHKAIVLDIVNAEIVSAMKDYATRKSSRPAAMKKAEKSAKHAESLLYMAIPKLEDKINQLLDSLR